MAGYVDADWHTCHRKLQAQFKERGGWCHQSAARAVTNGSTAERHTASRWLSAVSYLTFFPPCRFLVFVSCEDAILRPQQKGDGGGGGGGVTFVIVRVMPCVRQTFWLGLNGQLAINTNGSLANHTVATQQHLGLQFHKLLLICCDFHHLTTISRVYRLQVTKKQYGTIHLLIVGSRGTRFYRFTASHHSLETLQIAIC